VPQTVVTITLDSCYMIFLLRKSIEVEGFEHAVLKGAQKVLETHPRIFVEVTKHHDEIGKLLRDADHKLQAAKDPTRRL
jgi:chemotaxis receptor (MCP) glutamine deamidase CheD